MSDLLAKGLSISSCCKKIQADMTKEHEMICTLAGVFAMLIVKVVQE